MRKFFTLVVVAICYSAMAQSPFTILAPDFYKIPAFHLSSSHTTVEGVHSNFVYFSDLQDNSENNHSTDGLYTISKDGSSCVQTLLTLPEEYRLFDGLEGDGEFVAFYSSYDKKEKMFGLYVNTMSVDGSPAQWAPEEFVSYPCEKRDGNYLETATSPDRKKMAILISAADKKNVFKGTILTVFDNQGSKLWQKELQLDLSEQIINVLDLAITDRGTVYVAVGVYQAPNNRTRTHEEIHLYEIAEGGVNDFVQEVDFGYVTNGKMLVARNGDIVIGGYYKTEVKANESGSYICRFKPNASIFESMDNKEFEGYTRKGGNGVMGNNIADDNYWVTVESIFEFENGNIALLGEQKYSVVYTNNNNGSVTTTYKYWAKNIMYTVAAADGRITGFDMFQKNQVASSGVSLSHKYLGISYYAFMQDNQIRILYADNYNNYRGKSGQTLIKLPKSQEALVMLTIDGENEDNVKVLFDTKTSKTWMVRPMFALPDAFVAITKSGKSWSICNVAIQ